MTTEQIANLRIGDTIRVCYKKPFIGVFVRVDTINPNIICLKDSPESHALLCVDIRDPRLELVVAERACGVQP